MSDNEGGSFLWFLAGLGIGAAVGILYAPKSGGEVRQRIWEVAEEGARHGERACEAGPRTSRWLGR